MTLCEWEVMILKQHGLKKGDTSLFLVLFCTVNLECQNHKHFGFFGFFNYHLYTTVAQQQCTAL